MDKSIDQSIYQSINQRYLIQTPTLKEEKPHSCIKKKLMSQTKMNRYLNK